METATMKIMLIGSKGQLGSDLLQVLTGWEVTPFTHADFDVCDHVRTREIIHEVKPEVVINTSAFHKVEACEEKPEKALQVNALAVRNLAEECVRANCRLVHLSSDYVFAGNQTTPYRETDTACPANVYGLSKLAGEHLVRQVSPRHLIVRTSGLYGVAGASGKGGNFVELMIRLAHEGKPIKVVDDQVLTPTYTRDLAGQLRRLIRVGAQGLCHVTNSGYCSWYEFAGHIFRLLNLRPDFAPTTTAAFGAKVKRPAYSVLAHEALTRLTGSDARPWDEALRAYLEDKGYLPAIHARAA
jgi:dTDP-4-dehydrorhamnose reductase